MTKRRRSTLLLVLVAAIGCGSDTTFPSTVVSVQVTAAPGVITAFGQTRQFSAVVQDQYGNTLTGKTVAWRSSLPSVATVDGATGLVTAVANGMSNITATVDFVTGSGVVTVAQQATKLVFIAVPFTGTAGRVFSPAVKVEIEDAAGARVATATDAVTLAFGTNPSGAAFVGPTTAAAVGGIATFSGLAIDKAGAGFTLAAAATGLTGITSTAFTLAPAHGPFAMLAPGLLHTCGVTVAGPSYCWGANSSGQLGDGTMNSRSYPELVAGSAAFVALTSGSNHTCGLTAAGAAYCWGANSFGQLGDGSMTGRSTPTLVTGNHIFAAVSAGFYHTCGVTTAGAIYCWGYNNSGQLGDGSTTDHATPMPVSGMVVFDAVSASSAGHTCGRTAGNDVYCWGDNSPGATQLSPVLFADSLDFTAVSVGEFHACGLTGAATYCWGSNSSGQLGNGTTASDSSPVLVMGGLTFTAVSPGGLHTCGVTAANAAYCWGNGTLDQVGDGTATDRLTPTLVAGGLSLASVSAGNTHTCGLTPARVAYCWGFNLTGALGDGTTVSRSAPVPVSP